MKVKFATEAGPSDDVVGQAERRDFLAEIVLGKVAVLAGQTGSLVVGEDRAVVNLDCSCGRGAASEVAEAEPCIAASGVGAQAICVGCAGCVGV